MQKNSGGLRSIQDVPERFRGIFAEYPCFNRVQSTVFDDLMHSECSLVVTAPTGSGKTALFELALVKLFMNTSDIKNIKAVYIAPVKALCSERYQDWAKKFEPLGVSCLEITGDSIQQEDIRDPQLIMTTPEKWDSITRRWRDGGVVQMVKLVMIDEVHLLSEPKRGPTLEAIVCRMKTIMGLMQHSSLRFIAVSATIVNIEDLAEWLTTDQSSRCHRFGNEMRPVALKRVVKGFPMSKTPYLFDIQLSYKLKQIIINHSEGKPVLIFCSTRRGTSQTIKTLLEQIKFSFNDEQQAVLDQVASRLDDSKLRDMVRMGGGYHHAGLTINDRTAMQDIFMQGHLPLLVATSTLAMGVNLPAHLVIIKSTHHYVAGRVLEYPEASILQMVGRAGRPQFDSSATAVILTRSDMVKRYTDLLDCKEVLESSLHLQLAEHLNSEIVLGTIKDLSVAMEWLRCSFLFQRALKNPRHYGLTVTAENPGRLQKDLEMMVIREFNGLQRSGLVELKENGMDISPTDDGRLMSHYYISFDTFKLFADVTPNASMKSLLKILSEANELSEVQLRMSERRTLNELNKSKANETIRFSLSDKIKTRELKIQCLIQACLGCLSILDPSLQQEALRIVHSFERITKCLTEYLSRKNAYCALLSSVVLTKCLHAKLWENSVFIARQLERIGPMLGLCLVKAGKTTFDALSQTHPHELERIMNRGPPLGTNIVNQIQRIPKYRLDVQIQREGVLKAQIVVSVAIENLQEIGNLENSTAGPHHAVALVVGDSSNRLLKYKRVFDRSLFEGSINIQAAVTAPMPQKVFIHLVSEQWVGLDIVRDFYINPLAAAKVGAQDFLLGAEPKVKEKGKKQVKCDSSQNKKGENGNQKTNISSYKKPTAAAQSVAIQTKIGSVQHLNVAPEVAAHVSCFDLEPDVFDLSLHDEISGSNPVQLSQTVSPWFNERVQATDNNSMNHIHTSLHNEDNVFSKNTNLSDPAAQINNNWNSPSVVVSPEETLDSVLESIAYLHPKYETTCTSAPSFDDTRQDVNQTDGTWRITQVLQPQSSANIVQHVDHADFDVDFENLSMVNDEPLSQEVQCEVNPKISLQYQNEGKEYTVDDCAKEIASSEKCPVFTKKRRVTFLDGATDYERENSPVPTEPDPPCNFKSDEDVNYLDISPPHPLLLQNSESNDNFCEKIMSGNHYLPPSNDADRMGVHGHIRTPPGSCYTARPEWNTLFAPNFHSEVRKIVGTVLSEEFITNINRADSPQTYNSWKTLEDRLVSQTPQKKSVSFNQSRSQCDTKLPVGPPTKNQNLTTFQDNGNLSSRNYLQEITCPAENKLRINCASAEQLTPHEQVQVMKKTAYFNIMSEDNRQNVVEKIETQPKLLAAANNKAGFLKRALHRNLTATGTPVKWLPDSQVSARPAEKMATISKLPLVVHTISSGSQGRKEMQITGYYPKVAKPPNKEDIVGCQRKNLKSSACKSLLDQLNQIKMLKTD